MNNDTKRPMPAEIESLRKLPIPELVERYTQQFGKPPRMKHREFLWKRIAWKMQESACGGLSNVAKARLEELISRIELPPEDSLRTIAGKLKSVPTTRRISPATTIEREWHEMVYHIRVVDAHTFELVETGVVYKSLSALAFAITGTKWNGNIFFGLTKRKRKTPTLIHNEDHE